MSDRCMSAWTALTPSEPGVYVEFTNIYEMDDGRIRFTIRQRGDSNAPYATLYMSKAEAIKYLNDALLGLLKDTVPQ